MAWTAFSALTLILAAAAFGISPQGAHHLRGFIITIDASRENPEFRAVGQRYVRQGSLALQARFWGIPAGKTLYTLRRLPGLPVKLAAKEHLALHYQHFSEGPLSAYLHLTARQGMKDAVAMLELLGKQQTITDDDARTYLGSFDVWPPVVTDAGAVASLRKLINDVDPSRPFAFRSPLDQAILPHIHAVARSMNIPPEPARMTATQQDQVLSRLDDAVKQADPELWRAKQVSDFLNGVWGQTFGRPYASFAQWVLRIRLAAQVALAILLASIAILIWKKRRPPHPISSPPAVL